MRKRVKVIVPLVLLFLAALLVQCYIFYPGYMSHDSAYQYSQVVSGDWNNISPIVMVGLWTLSDALISGPGGLFLLFQSIALLGLMLFVVHLKLKLWLKISLVLLIYFWPFNLMIMPHLWKDVGLMSFLFLSIGCMQVYKHNGQNKFFLMAMVALIIASMFRFESILYLSPLIYYYLRFFFKNNDLPPALAKLMLLTFGVIFISFALTQIITKLSDSKKITLWQTVALWDMARVSIKTQQLLLPEFTTGQGMTLEDLSNANTSWTNTHLFSKTQSGVNDGLSFPYTKQQNITLFKTWLNMIQTYPGAYLSHRAEVSSELLRIIDAENKPIDIFYTRNHKHFSDGHTLNDSTINKQITGWINSHLNNFYFKGWFYLLCQLILFALVIFKNLSTDKGLVLALVSSGVLSVMTLTFVAPSAEQRYLIWLVNSTLLAISLLFKQKHESTKEVINTNLESNIANQSRISSR